MPRSRRVACIAGQRHRRDKRVDREQAVDRDRRSEKEQQKARELSAGELRGVVGDRFRQDGKEIEL